MACHLIAFRDIFQLCWKHQKVCEMWIIRCFVKDCLLHVSSQISDTIRLLSRLSLCPRYPSVHSDLYIITSAQHNSDSRDSHEYTHCFKISWKGGIIADNAVSVSLVLNISNSLLFWHIKIPLLVSVCTHQSLSNLSCVRVAVVKGHCRQRQFGAII